MQIITDFDYTVILALVAKYGLRLLFSFFIFFIGKWVVGRICLILESVIRRAKIDELIASFIINAAKTILLIVVIVAALANLGIETTSFVAMLGAIGLGIGQNLLGMGAKGIDVNDFAQAIKDVLDGNETAITHTEARDIVNKYFQELEEKMNAGSNS